MAGVREQKAGRIVSEGCGHGHGQVGGLQREGTLMAGRGPHDWADWARAQGSWGRKRVSCSSAGHLSIHRSCISVPNWVCSLPDVCTVDVVIFGNA